MTRIDEYDLNLFEFDYDLTMMIFFLDPEGKQIYARYGQRDGRSPDDLQSLEGLRYTIESVLAMHRSKEPAFASRLQTEYKSTRDIQGAGRGRRCYHCHNVREALNRELRLQGKWTREMAWRYPLPENVGLTLEVNRGNRVDKVLADSPAAKIGLAPGDQLEKVGDIPIHSIADVQLALDRTPARAQLELSWKRDGKVLSGTMALTDGWRKSDISWRPSLLHMVAGMPLYGRDLTAEEKKTLGIDEKRLAFRQKDVVHSRARAAGIKGGDVILGVDGKKLENMDVDEFLYYIQREYLSGDRVLVNIIRDGKPMDLAMTLQ